MSSKKGKKDDSRFTKFQTDPKFRNVPQKAKKVAIDERFQGMFKEEKFLNKVSVDQRGRKNKSYSSKDQYKRYYSLEKQDRDQREKEDSDSSDSDSDSSAEEEEIDDATKAKLKDLKGVDYARGEGGGRPLLSDSSSEEEDSSDDDDGGPHLENEEEEENFDKWGELDHDAENTDEISRRLAVCNMDWDRVEAEDLFLALASFCPNGGRIDKVTVLTSEFGKKRLQEEDLLGPEELRAKDSLGDMEDEDSSDDEGPSSSKTQEQINTKAMERVRRYQVNRLKYYYAIAEFDSEETANKVYEECDGTEYELSATRFDLRFIPDEMEFENEDPKSVCDRMPDPNKYKPKLFCTTALQQGKVELTWDETDPDRMKTMRRAFEEDDEDDDVKAYLASESEEEENEEKEPAESGLKRGEDENPRNENQNSIEVYKALLADINNTEKKQKEERGNMEITFTPSDTVKETMAKKEVAQMSPWEQYLHKKKEKADAKREKRKKVEVETKEDSDDDDDDQEADGKAFSDDEIPDDLDFEDSFFQGATGEERKKNKKDKKKGKKVDSDDDKKGGGDLSLLVMDSDEEKGHFDYKDIVAKESSTSKKKKKKLAKELAKKQHDDFELDLKDDRFHAVFDQADFNVDPSHPSFKKTKSMQKIITEKQKRFLEDDNPDLPSSKKKKNNPPSSGSDKKASNQLDHLVKAVQSKTKLQQDKNADAAKKKKKRKPKA